jgi:predicted PurR-regulated permease PerM
MEHKLKKIKIYFNNFLDKYVKKNIIILSISLVFFNICLFSSTGIIYNIRSFTQENIKLQKKYISIQKNIINLKQKIYLLSIKNIEMIEEINYKYKNLLPYNSYQVIILEK